MPQEKNWISTGWTCRRREDQTLGITPSIVVRLQPMRIQWSMGPITKPDGVKDAVGRMGSGLRRSWGRGGANLADKVTT